MRTATVLAIVPVRDTLPIIFCDVLMNSLSTSVGDCDENTETFVFPKELTLDTSIEGAGTLGIGVAVESFATVDKCEEQDFAMSALNFDCGDGAEDGMCKVE